MQARPQIGEPLCLVIRRGRVHDAADAVYGFEVTAVTSESFDVVPVSARISRPALGGRAPSDIEVSVGFASGLYQRETSQMVSAARFSFGSIAANGQPRRLNLPAQRLRWPEPSGRFDILRIGAVVVESQIGYATAISEEALTATLSPRP
jgi:hypothetical protein